jgi:ribonuclease BN (tRNA processing enzyme)
MKLTILGSGMSTHVPGTTFRYPASYLVEANSYKLLLDAGIGVLPQLARLGVALTDIRTICISHFHADHFAIAPILQAYYLYAKNGDATDKPSLHILGPGSVEERVRSACQGTGWTFDDDILSAIDLTFTNYRDAEEVSLSPAMKLTAFRTKHYALDAYALRLREQDKILAYSGDSTYSPGLDQAARDADLLLCEAALASGATSDEGHLGPQGAATVARNQHSKKLVLTHYPGKDTPASMSRAASSTGYTGNICIANDLDIFEL